MYKTEKIDGTTFTPQKFESDHSITINGIEIPYHTICEDNVFYDEHGKAIASIFSYSYFRTDVQDKEHRPVIFGYNGGPGSSSMYVHAGFLGTKRLKYGKTDRESALGDYEIIDNPNCLIDVADIVLIDPVATGFGLLIDEEKGKDFFGIEQDAESILTFMESWLQRYKRFASPKYLCGESYGCTRSAFVAGKSIGRNSNRSFGWTVDGIIFIGNTVTNGKYFGEGMPVETSVIGFPTYAAVNWYHRHPTEQTIEQWVAEAKEFADNEYQLALYKGESLSEEKREYIKEKVSYYTGVTKEYLQFNGLKIDDDRYRIEALKEEGKAVGRYDGRVTRVMTEPAVIEEREGIWDDATSDRYGNFFYSALNGKIIPYLNINLERNFVASYAVYKDWNKEEPNGITADMLRRYMNKTPGTRVLFCNGWYDLCTELGYIYYLLDHTSLPKDRVDLKCYHSGHMIYIGEENVKALSDDIRAFVTNK